MAALITPADYPSEAFRAKKEGNVAVRLTVSAAGRASNCTIRRSSGYKALDDAACWLLKRRARFVPALDAAGKPTQGQFDHLVMWKITDEIRRVMR